MQLSNAPPRFALHVVVLPANIKSHSALEIPGNYRFDALDNKKCGAIGTMMPIGSKASYLNMGGCLEAMENGCDGGIPPSCADYLVDLGKKQSEIAFTFDQRRWVSHSSHSPTHRSSLGASHHRDGHRVPTECYDRQWK